MSSHVYNYIDEEDRVQYLQPPSFPHPDDHEENNEQSYDEVAMVTRGLPSRYLHPPSDDREQDEGANDYLEPVQRNKSTWCSLNRKIIIIVVVLLLGAIAATTFAFYNSGNGGSTEHAWLEWSLWGPCSITCGHDTGMQERVRVCNAAGEHRSLQCQGPDTEIQNCSSTLACSFSSGWTKWSSWSACPVSCGTGVQQRVRSCTAPKEDRALYCQGIDRETRDCSASVWSEWGSWHPCPVSCGNGIQQRVRSSVSAVHHSLKCPEDTETQKCSTSVVCPLWSEWGLWGECLGACIQERVRSCTAPEEQHDIYCPGTDRETKNCLTSGPCSQAAVCYQPYITLSEIYRRESVSDLSNCDKDKIHSTSWYRFNLVTGENGVLDHCPRWHTCGTGAPIWTNDSHPTQYGVIKDVTMAESVRGSETNNCFHSSGSASVTKCNVNGDVFYLYKLWKPIVCYYSYCTRRYEL